MSSPSTIETEPQVEARSNDSVSTTQNERRLDDTGSTIEDEPQVPDQHDASASTSQTKTRGSDRPHTPTLDASQSEQQVTAQFSAPKSGLAKQEDMSPEQLSELFADISLTSNARIVLSHPDWAHPKTTTMVELPKLSDDWNMAAVTQQARDVRMHIQMPYDPPTDKYPLDSPFELDCSIYYDPIDNSCLFQNATPCDIMLENISGELNCLEYLQSTCILPGFWRIKVKSAHAEIHVLDFFMTERSFEVTLQRPVTKRKFFEDGEPSSAKRQKQSQVVLSPVHALNFDRPTKNSDQKSDTVDQNIKPALNPVQEASDVLGFANANNGAVASISSSDETYTLTQRDDIFKNQSTIVLQLEHSDLPGDTVAKIMRYMGDPGSLISFARLWKRETELLETLTHVSTSLVYQPYPPPNAFILVDVFFSGSRILSP